MWHSTESNFAASDQAAILYNEFEKYTFITALSSRGQWVNSLRPRDAYMRQ